MSDQKYNGWTNYETWLVNVWMSNSEGDSQYWDEQTREVVGEDFPVSRLSERIEEWLDASRAELVADSTAGLMSDLLNGAIRSANTDEIAQNLVNNYAE